LRLLQKHEKNFRLPSGIWPGFMVKQGNGRETPMGRMCRFTPHRAGMHHASNGEKAAD
jgi:hypothetical protein